MFTGLTDADFEAYAPKKWKSNVYNRERLEVKQKLLALGRDLSPLLLASDGSPLTLEASVEHPALWNHKQVEAQHIYFSRHEGARKEIDAIIERGQSLASMLDDPTPQRRHVFLALTLTHDRLEAALRLHPDARVDRQNLERKCEDHYDREKMVILLERLPAGYQFGVATAPLLNAATATEQAVSDALATFHAPATGSSTLSLGGLPMSPSAPAAPVRFFQVVHVLPRAEALATSEQVAAFAHDSLAALLPLYRFIAWSRENDYVSIRDTLQKEKLVKRQRGLARNDEVRVVRGMLTGKVGVIQAIDARGGLRVLVGKMALKLDAEDVVKS